MHNYLTPNFAFAPMMPSRAEGSRIWDENGKEYLDLSGGIAVNALGHCHPELIAALTEQAHKYWHVSNYFTTAPAQHLAQRLVDNTFADKVFFANSGAEANEAALKLARKYAHDHFGKHKTEIVSCVNAFHGRTLFTVSVGGQPKYSQDFAPLPENITHVPFNDVEAVRQAVSDKTCAVIFEPIQGESGVLPATREFMQAAREVCDTHQSAFILDEVQTGMGRTGKLFSYQHHHIQPDILTSAKALGGGLPIGAMLTTDKFASAFTVGSHGSTFGGNPLVCAVACRAFDLINAPETLANANQQGEKLRAALVQLGQEFSVFQTVRGQGLLLGAVLCDEYSGKVSELVRCCLKNGLLVLGAGANVMRLAPSLLINNADLDEAIVRLRTALAQFVAS